MSSAALPSWIDRLDEEELQFLKRFVLASGSLKETANAYGITYPTIRIRLDRIIEKIRAQEQEPTSYVSLIRKLALEDRIDVDTAKVLIDAYRKQQHEI